ncbi:MAG: FkbM family methyltransferase [Bacillota bacterium]
MFKKMLKKLIEPKFTTPENNILLLAMGAMLSKQQWAINSDNINDYEFKIFSQFGDDGIIQYLIKNLQIENEIFIEFGVGNYLESNTRFLMMNNNWSGFVMDGSEQLTKILTNQDWYWQYNITHKSVFIDKTNINELLLDTGFTDIGLLHVDIDGNDYHLFDSIDLSKLNPAIVILEYNSVFGGDRAITVPYRRDFVRTKAHYSNLYWGASLPAMVFVARKNGYSLIGCNNAGNNAYFIRNDLLNEKVKELSVKKAYRESRFRESWNKDGELSFLKGRERLEIIKGLEVINVETGEKEII